MISTIKDKAVVNLKAATPVIFILFAFAFSGNASDNQSLPNPSELKKLSIEELMDIEVTSVSKRPEKLSETPSAIQVITGDDIRRSGATSIPEALRLATNLQVAQKNSSSWGISSRGFNADLANKLLVLLDGRTIYTPLYSGVFWGRQDYLLEDIDRIEVISGPGGTLWGANAVNGVINIITKHASESQDLYVEQFGGSELLGAIGVRYGGKVSPNMHYRAYAKHFDRDNSVYSDGRDANDSWWMSQYGFRMDKSLVSNGEITLQGDYYQTDQRILAGGTGEVSGGNLLGRWNHHFSDESDMSLQAYYDRTNLSLYAAAFIVNNILLAPAGRFEDELDTYDVDFNHRILISDRHQFIWGLGYRFSHDVVTNAPSLGFLPTKLDQDLFSAFLQDEFSLTDNVDLTLGSKIEHNDYTGWEIEPNARLAWHLNSRNMFWAAVSRAVRAPSRIDRDVTQATPPYFVLLVGGPDFESETVIANELGYKSSFSSRFAGTVSVFYNVYDNIRSTSLTPTFIFPLFFENNVYGKTHGLELTGNFSAADWWQLTGGYTFLKSDLWIKEGEMDFNQTLNEISDPRHQFSVSSRMDLPNQINLDMQLRWVDILRTHDGPTPGTVPNYVELDVRAARQIVEHLELSIVGQNLLHDHHPEYGYGNPSRVEIQRNLYAKAAWRF